MEEGEAEKGMRQREETNSNMVMTDHVKCIVA